MYKIMAVCENGHTQTINFDETFGLEWVELQAGLLDGTSPMYVYSPIGTDSAIGKCGICKSQIKCTVDEASKKTKAVIYSRPECIYMYCPIRDLDTDPEGCKLLNKCLFPAK